MRDDKLKNVYINITTLVSLKVIGVDNDDTTNRLF